MSQPRRLILKELTAQRDGSGATSQVIWDYLEPTVADIVEACNDEFSGIPMEKLGLSIFHNKVSRAVILQKR